MVSASVSEHSSFDGSLAVSTSLDCSPVVGLILGIDAFQISSSCLINMNTKSSSDKVPWGIVLVPALSKLNLSCKTLIVKYGRIFHEINFDVSGQVKLTGSLHLS